MLRTHSDLGYKQEQRFHLELGLLKLVYAQRLLPLEQLLSGEAVRSASAPARQASLSAPRAAIPAARPSAPEASHSRPAAVVPFKGPSPFEADRTRKSEPKAEAPAITAPPVSSGIGSIADVASSVAEAPLAASAAVAIAEEPQPVPEAAGLSIDALRNDVLAALEEAGQQMLAHNLETGEWSLRGNEVSVKVAMSQVMCDVALGDVPKRIVGAALAKATGKPMKFKMVSGGAQFVSKPASSVPRPANGAGARSRAMSDPVVQRMQEKFGAEIRSVIDNKDRG
jgi:DNA polymerase-3 subunit gamma/tau